MKFSELTLKQSRMSEAIAQQKFSCLVCDGDLHQIDPTIANPNGIGIIQPSVDAQRLRWVIVQANSQL